MKYSKHKSTKLITIKVSPIKIPVKSKPFDQGRLSTKIKITENINPNTIPANGIIVRINFKFVKLRLNLPIFLVILTEKKKKASRIKREGKVKSKIFQLSDS